MTLIEGSDFYVYPIMFPNYANKGMVTPNVDGTYSVYVNTRYPQEQYPGIVKHELDHIINDDFYKEELDIRFVEDLN